MPLATIANLWGDLQTATEAQPESPIKILQQQGVFLAQMTGGLLEGRVVPVKVDLNKSEFDFQIKAPLLNNYSVSVFRLYQQQGSYPAMIKPLLPEGRGGGSKDVTTFKKCLEAVLSAPSVKKVVATLLEQSRALAGK